MPLFQVPQREDRRCQWCKRVLAVWTGTQYVDIADHAEFQGRRYCDGASGTCLRDLLAMAQYVNDNFGDGRAH